MGYTDDLILNSMMRNHEDNPESLEKAMNRAGLVQKEVQVRGKNGQIFMRKQWVKASEDQPIQKPAGKPDEDKSKSDKTSKNSQQSHFTGKNMDELLSNLKNSGYEMDSADQHQPQDTVTLYKDKQEFTATFNKYSDGGVEVINIKPNKQSEPPKNEEKSEQKTDNKSEEKQDSSPKESNSSFTTPSNKQDLVKLLQSGASREDIMAQAEKDGITWKKSDHPGINWMRASMAITGTTTRGDKSKSDSDSTKKTENKKDEESDSKKENNTSDKSDSKSEDGIELDKFFGGDGFPKPTNETEAYYAVESAYTDHGGLKVEDSVLTVDDNAKIYQSNGSEKKEISYSDALKLISGSDENNTDNSKDESYSGTKASAGKSESIKRIQENKKKFSSMSQSEYIDFLSNGGTRSNEYLECSLMDSFESFNQTGEYTTLINNLRKIPSGKTITMSYNDKSTGEKSTISCTKSNSGWKVEKDGSDITKVLSMIGEAGADKVSNCLVYNLTHNGDGVIQDFSVKG